MNYNYYQETVENHENDDENHDDDVNYDVDNNDAIGIDKLSIIIIAFHIDR